MPGQVFLNKIKDKIPVILSREVYLNKSFHILSSIFCRLKPLIGLARSGKLDVVQLIMLIF